jgi:hypothetical protein
MLVLRIAAIHVNLSAPQSGGGSAAGVPERNLPVDRREATYYTFRVRAPHAPAFAKPASAGEAGPAVGLAHPPYGLRRSANMTQNE